MTIDNQLQLCNSDIW